MSAVQESSPSDRGLVAVWAGRRTRGKVGGGEFVGSSSGCGRGESGRRG
jgi:hypothetical protein